MATDVALANDTDRQLSFNWGRFQFGPTSLQASDSLTFDEWDKCGEYLSKLGRTVHWWIGDWLNMGEQKWGEMYAQAMHETRFAYDTVRADAYVAERFQFVRRRTNLSFSHHRDVSSLAEAEQDYWLDAAEKGDGDGGPWSSKRLREEIRIWKAQSDAPHPPTETPHLPPTPVVLDAPETYEGPFDDGPQVDADRKPRQPAGQRAMGYDEPAEVPAETPNEPSISITCPHCGAITKYWAYELLRIIQDR